MNEFRSRMQSGDYTEGYFERGVGSNYRAYGDDPGWNPTVLSMMSYLPPHARVLEVAAAKGYFLAAAQRFGMQADGIDISVYAVAHAAKAVRDHLSLGNAVSLPWSDKEADAVCSWEFLEHVYEDEIDQVLFEMARVLKHDHMMWHRIGLEADDDMSGQDVDVTHVWEAPESWWRAKFMEHGLERHKGAEFALNRAFEGRDWQGRFFVYRKP